MIRSDGQSRIVDNKSWSQLADFLDRFDEAWHRGDVPDIKSFWQSAENQSVTDPAIRRRFWEELVKIDLEYRWKRAETLAGQARPRLEYYSALSPQEVAGFSVETIGWEYRVRHQWGDRPAQQEYLQRFARHANELGEILRQMDAELAAERPERIPVAVAAKPVVASTAALIEMLRKQQLVGPGELSTIAGSRAGDARALAKEMIQREWLTPYQVNQLLTGRADELVLGPYVVIERLGEGGAGQVFKARHRLLKRLAALKLIRKDLLRDAEAVGRFHREIQAISRLDHPNIVKAYDAGQAGAAHYLAMEFVEGSDLGRMVKRGGPLPVVQACDYIRQAALGLHHAHESGLIHRDIKPHNLLVNARDGLVKVADLGLARLQQATDKDLTAVVGSMGTLTPQHAVLIGTADYMAPEQAMDFHLAGPRADVYSLGCTFFYLLTGQPPFPANTLAEKLVRHQQSPPPGLERLCPGVPPKVSALVKKMLAKQPEARPPLSEVSATLGKGTPGTSAAARKNRRRLLLAGAVGGGAVLLGWPLVGLLTSGRVKKHVWKHGSRAHCLAFSADGRWLASAGDGNLVNVWNVATGEKAAAIEGLRSRYRFIAFSPDGNWLAWSGHRNGVEVINLKDIATVRERSGSLKPRGIGCPYILSLMFRPDSGELLAAVWNSVIAIHPVSGQTTTVKRDTSGADERKAAFLPDSKVLAIGQLNGTVVLYHTSTGKVIHRLEMEDGYITELLAAPDGKALASVSNHKTARVWNMSGFRERSHAFRQSSFVALAFTRDGKHLAAAGTNGVNFWDTTTGRIEYCLEAKAVVALEISPDGRILATADAGGTIRLLDMADMDISP